MGHRCRYRSLAGYVRISFANSHAVPGERFQNPQLHDMALTRTMPKIPLERCAGRPASPV